MKANGTCHDGLALLEPDDLALLLATEPARVLGTVLSLNREVRYHNSLNAVVIAELVFRLRQVVGTHSTEGWAANIPVPSKVSPASSGSNG